jgi:hypothetical protein
LQCENRVDLAPVCLALSRQGPDSSNKNSPTVYLALHHGRKPFKFFTSDMRLSSDSLPRGFLTMSPRVGDLLTASLNL